MHMCGGEEGLEIADQRATGWKGMTHAFRHRNAEESPPYWIVSSMASGKRLSPTTCRSIDWETSLWWTLTNSSLTNWEFEKHTFMSIFGVNESEVEWVRRENFKHQHSVHHRTSGTSMNGGYRAHKKNSLLKLHFEPQIRDTCFLVKFNHIHILIVLLTSSSRDKR